MISIALFIFGVWLVGAVAFTLAGNDSMTLNLEWPYRKLYRRQ